MSVPVSRTHVVDLGVMSREQVIDVAKKQANQIRQKNKRITALISLIESVTNGAMTEEMIDQSIAADENAASAVAQTGSEGAGGAATHAGDYRGMGSSSALRLPQAISDPHSKRAASTSSSLLSSFLPETASALFRLPGSDAADAGSADERGVGDHLASDLQEAMEEERLQFVSRISALEEDLRGKEEALAAKSRELAALQTKVEAWRHKVTAILETDRRQIDSLTSELNVLRQQQQQQPQPQYKATSGVRGGDSAPAVASPAPRKPGSASSLFRDSAASSSDREPLTPSGGGSRKGVEDMLQKDVAGVSAVGEGGKGEEGRQDEWEAERARLHEEIDQLRRDNAALRATNPHLTSSSVSGTDALSSLAVEDAVQAKLAVWKERFTQTLGQLQERIDTLEAELAAARQQQSQPQSQHALGPEKTSDSAPTTAAIAGQSNALDDLFPAPADSADPTAFVASLDPAHHDAHAQTVASLQATLANTQAELQKRTDEVQRLQQALQAAGGAAAQRDSRPSVPCAECEVLRAQHTAWTREAAEATQQTRCAAERLENELLATQCRLASAVEREQEQDANGERQRRCIESLQGELQRAQEQLDALPELKERAQEDWSALEAENDALKEKLEIAELRCSELGASLAVTPLEQTRRTPSLGDDVVQADLADVLDRGLATTHARVTALTEVSLALKAENAALRARITRLQVFKDTICAELRRNERSS